MVFFVSLGISMNDETFQLVRKVFSFHVEMVFLTMKASLVIKRLKNENDLSQLKSQIKISRDGT